MYAHIYQLATQKCVVHKEMVHFWRMEIEKGEIWGKHPLDTPGNGEIHCISTTGRKRTKTLDLP